MTETITPAMTLAEIVNSQPALARELESRSLDYCCGGKRRLDEACAELGIDPQQVADELAERAVDEPVAPWVGMGPAELADHIQSVHHTYVHEELPRLSALAEKVKSVHGERHPELSEVARVYEILRGEIDMHLGKEEEILFPMIRQLGSSDAPVEFHCGSLQNPISVMLAEHDQAGELLAELRRLTVDYSTPADACDSYKALYAGLEKFEEDLHLHIHKENNVLFPAVVELEASL